MYKYRVLKCDIIILQTFPFEPVIYTAAVRMWEKLKLLALMKVKIEKSEVLHSPILTSLI